jgi:hypothetical protein
LAERLVPTTDADAEGLLAQRRAAARRRKAEADDRWRRYQEAAARRAGLSERSRLEQRLDRVLARSKWPGRMLQIARSGLWRPRLGEALGYGGGAAWPLVRYVRAGPDPAARPRALFDQAWYLERNPELSGGAWAPVAHYLAVGDAQGRAPHPLFDVRGYRARHGVKVAASRLSTLRHFEAIGAAQGFDPHPLFDLRHYVGQCEAVAESGENPLVHYLRQGWRDGLDPHPLFAGDWYRSRYPEADANSAPLLHYVVHGAGQGLDPHPLFDARAYVASLREGLRGGLDPLTHFLRHGASERRNPSPWFDTAHYIEQHPELAERDVNPLVHYVTEGTFVGSWPAPDFDEAAYLAGRPELAASNQSGLAHWLETGGDRPAPSLEPSGRWAPAQALFEQLRAAGRPGEAATYNLQAYEALSAELRQAEAQRRAGPAPAQKGAAGSPIEAIAIGPEAMAAAHAAEGAEILVFASVEACGRAAALTRALAAHPDAAIAAPRLVTPEGRLWAAGARLGRDGRLIRNGAGEPPDAWARAREIDCAAEVFAIRRSDFLEAGGFDDGFRTAGQAVADLCLRLRARGRGTILAPSAEWACDAPPPADDPADAQRLMDRHAAAIETLTGIRVIALMRPEQTGFAAWLAASRALPDYRGHLQPRHPGVLGFYDPGDPITEMRQAALARRYGVHGFCRPAQGAPASAGQTFPDCLRVKAVVDPTTLIPTLAPQLADARQIRVDGRALLLVEAERLRPGWAAGLRQAARAEGLGELYLIRLGGFGARTTGDAQRLGLDAEAILPEAADCPAIPPPGPAFNAARTSAVRDYRELARRASAGLDAAPSRLPLVAPGHDDTPCGQGSGEVFHGASPGAFQAWLEAALRQVERTRFGDERLVFIDAWNGWTHGACLEPELRHGHGWLEAVRNAADADLLETS